MKLINCFIFCFFIVQVAFSQDVLYKSDGTVIEGKLIDHNGSFVRFSSVTLPEGDVLYFSTHLVDSIVREGGKTEVLDMIKDNPAPHLAKKWESQLGMDLISLGSGSCKLILERRSRQNGLGFYLPVSLNIPGVNALGNKDIWPFLWGENSLGVGMRFYVPLKPDFMKLSVGIHFVAGRYAEYNVETSGLHFAEFIPQNGVEFTFNDRLSLKFALEVKYYNFINNNVEFYPVLRLEGYYTFRTKTN